MLYHAVIGKSNNDDAILGFEGYHSRKKLVRMYKEYIREEFDDDRNLLENAVVRGAMDRLRPMLLTSLTTIGGLSALMFEKSLQAQFLIPMATTITFGLAVTSILVLFVVPAMIGVTNDVKNLVKLVIGVFGVGANSKSQFLQMDD